MTWASNESKPRGRPAGSPSLKVARPRNITKVASISARCRECGALLLRRMSWTPGPLREFAEEVRESVGSCPECEHELGEPVLNDIRLVLLKEDPK